MGWGWPMTIWPIHAMIVMIEMHQWKSQLQISMIWHTYKYISCSKYNLQFQFLLHFCCQHHTTTVLITDASRNLTVGSCLILLQLRKAFRCNSFGLCPKCWPKNFQFSSVNLCHKAIILLKIAQKMDKTLWNANLQWMQESILCIQNVSSMTKSPLSTWICVFVPSLQCVSEMWPFKKKKKKEPLGRSLSGLRFRMYMVWNAQKCGQHVCMALVMIEHPGRAFKKVLQVRCDSAMPCATVWGITRYNHLAVIVRVFTYIWALR